MISRSVRRAACLSHSAHHAAQRFPILSHKRVGSGRDAWKSSETSNVSQPLRVDGRRVGRRFARGSVGLDPLPKRSRVVFRHERAEHRRDRSECGGPACDVWQPLRVDRRRAARRFARGSAGLDPLPKRSRVVFRHERAEHRRDGSGCVAGPRATCGSRCASTGGAARLAAVATAFACPTRSGGASRRRASTRSSTRSGVYDSRNTHSGQTWPQQDRRGAHADADADADAQAGGARPRQPPHGRGSHAHEHRASRSLPPPTPRSAGRPREAATRSLSTVASGSVLHCWSRALFACARERCTSANARAAATSVTVTRRRAALR